MRISTIVVVRVVIHETQEQISESSGPSSGFVVPRVGEFINTPFNSKFTLFEVVSVKHEYNESYRNVTTIYVKHCDPLYHMYDEE